MGSYLNEERLLFARNLIIGIDNGLKGAVVALDNEANIVGWWDTPYIPFSKGKKTVNEFAPAAMRDILYELHKQKTLKVWLEVAHAMPSQGLSSTFKTGKGAGLWEGIVVGLRLKYDVVHAKTWTKETLKDIPKGDPKQRSMLKCQRIFPSIPLTKPKGHVLCMDGRSDAALIAYYGYLQAGGSEPEKSSIKRPVKIKGKR